MPEFRRLFHLPENRGWMSQSKSAEGRELYGLASLSTGTGSFSPNFLTLTD